MKRHCPGLVGRRRLSLDLAGLTAPTFPWRGDKGSIPQPVLNLSKDAKRPERAPPGQTGQPSGWRRYAQNILVGGCGLLGTRPLGTASVKLFGADGLIPEKGFEVGL